MASIAPVECDLVDKNDGQKLRTVRLSVIPRAGDILDLDFGDGQQEAVCVVEVRYHIRPRKLVRTDDLLGISIFVSSAP
jgi:hypothetical protein